MRIVHTAALATLFIGVAFTASAQVSVDPEMAKALAGCFGKTESIIEACGTVIETPGPVGDQYRINALIRRGAAYFTQGDYEKGMADTNESIKLNPNYPAAYLNRAVANFETGQFADALNDSGMAIRLNPRHAQSRNVRAWVLFNMGRADEGLVDARLAVELDPADSASFDTLGHIYVAIGDKYRARAAFAAALDIDPNLESSQKGLKDLEEPDDSEED